MNSFDLQSLLADRGLLHPYQIVGCGVVGSRMYNLASEDSDTDYLYVVDNGLMSPTFTHVGGDDITIVSPEKYVEILSKAAPLEYVYPLFSKPFLWDKDSPKYAYMMAAKRGIDTRLLQDRLDSIVTAQCSAVLMGYKNISKDMRLALRCAVLNLRAGEGDLDPRFSDTLRDFVLDMGAAWKDLLPTGAERTVDNLRASVYNKVRDVWKSKELQEGEAR